MSAGERIATNVVAAVIAFFVIQRLAGGNAPAARTTATRPATQRPHGVNRGSWQLVNEDRPWLNA